MKILKKPLWITLTAVFAVLLAALIVGGVIPALRAAKLDPSKALRYE